LNVLLAPHLTELTTPLICKDFSQVQGNALDVLIILDILSMIMVINVMLIKKDGSQSVDQP